MNIFYFLKENLVGLLYVFVIKLLPSRKSKIKDIGVSMLLCHNDVKMAIYCLQSLFYQLGYALPVYIVSDGSLTKNDMKKINEKFSVIFESREHAILEMKKKYSNYPMFVKYLQDPEAHIKRVKFATLFLSPFNRTVCIEPDILFIGNPKAIDEFRISGNNYYGVLQDGIVDLLIKENPVEMIFRKLLYSRLGVPTNYLFNAGLMLINKVRLNKYFFKKIEKILEISYGLGYQKFLYYDEFLLGTIFDTKKDVLLPYERYFNIIDYTEYKNLKTTGNIKDVTMLHLTTNVRKLILFRSVDLVFSTGFFRKGYATPRP